MSLPELESYKSFIHNFQHVAKEKTGYVAEVGSISTYKMYEVLGSKTKALSNKEISTVAQNALGFLKTTLTISLHERVALLQDLGTALQAYSERVEESVRGRWWVRLLGWFGIHSLFGRPLAEKPQNIRALQKEVLEVARPMEQEEAARKKEQAQKEIEEKRKIDDQIRALQEQGKQIEKLREMVSKSPEDIFYDNRQKDFAAIEADMKGIPQRSEEELAEVLRANLVAIDRLLRDVGARNSLP